jgi:hypothetical protein
VGYYEDIQNPNEPRKGLLSWYSPDGQHLMDAVVADDQTPADISFSDVAISSDGYAVVAGHQRPSMGLPVLLVRKFAI